MKIKPGPKPGADRRHRMAAMYFAACLMDDGRSATRVAKLVLDCYGVKVEPEHLERWVAMYHRTCEKLPLEFRTQPDLVV
jgi:hypothetical protein